MSDTVLDQPLVLGYLHELSAACITLPAAQARELRAQIAAHLDEALRPGATEAEVRAELARLGSPRSLAAAAAPRRQSLLRRLWNLLGHVRWWAWFAMVIGAAAVVTPVSYTMLAGSATPLRQLDAFEWYFPQDAAHQVDTQLGAMPLRTVPARYRQEQGFIVNIVNDSDWTQTILGPAKLGLSCVASFWALH